MKRSRATGCTLCRVVCVVCSMRRKPQPIKAPINQKHKNTTGGEDSGKQIPYGGAEARMISTLGRGLCLCFYCDPRSRYPRWTLSNNDSMPYSLLRGTYGMSIGDGWMLEQAGLDSPYASCTHVRVLPFTNHNRYDRAHQAHTPGSPLSPHMNIRLLHSNPSHPSLYTPRQARRGHV